MKLSKKQFVLVSFMLFSLFFGAGNLIFPPFLGQNAGTNMPIATFAFLLTAVILPVLGVIVVARFDGLEKLAKKVHPAFAVVFTLLIYLSIGPGLGIPRAASVPFEMAVAPYLPSESNLTMYRILYSAIFFMIATWLALTPSKLVERIGKFLTPSLLILISLLFVSFLAFGHTSIQAPQGSYVSSPVVVGFLEGYNTMDAIAALNFGLVIATTIRTLGVKEEKTMLSYTVKCGLLAGTILALVYVVLAYLGMSTSGLYEVHENGAWVLRSIVKDVFGEPGAILLASIFTLACLTTCVGLITSISQYFSKHLTKVSYRSFVFMISLFSFLVCNQGLDVILSISVPVLNAIYPMAIVLILLGLMDRWIGQRKYVYSLTICLVGIVSVVYSLKSLHIYLGFVSQLCEYLPFYKPGMGWVSVALVGVVLGMLWKPKTELEPTLQVQVENEY